MNDHDHDRWRDDVAAYMLGALEPDEAAELELHAESCERCRSEMRWLTAAVEALPEAVGRLEPPRQLRERVMSEVRADAAGERRRSDAERYGEAAPGWAARASAWLRGLGSGPMGLRPIAGVAAAVLVVAVVAGFAISGGIGGGESGTSMSPASPRRSSRRAMAARCIWPTCASCRTIECSRPGSAAKARSNRCERFSFPTPRATPRRRSAT